MRYVIIRDDDTNAFTPPECIEQLYRPFLARGLPVNLATIPAVNPVAKMADGRLEGFLLGHGGNGDTEPRPIGSNPDLANYLKQNPGLHVVQHGCHHDYLEFGGLSAADAGRRLDLGTQYLADAGFPRSQTFVAPYDKVSRAGLPEVRRRFRVFSTGWFELRKLPVSWWPRYVVKKLRRTPHWRLGKTLLLTHPGCLLSYHRGYDIMLERILYFLSHSHVTVLVTHWWEYFRNGTPDKPFIEFLHQTGDYLATHPDIKVISFDDLLKGDLAVN